MRLDGRNGEGKRRRRGDFVGNEKLLPKWELYLANLYEAANTANLLCGVPEREKTVVVLQLWTRQFFKKFFFFPRVNRF